MTSARRKAVAKAKHAAALVAPLAACSALAAYFGLEALAPRSFEYRELLEGYVLGGERLIHGVDTGWIIDRLPSACVLAAALFRSPLATNAALVTASVALLALLLCAVESLLEAPALFGLAAVVAALFCRWEYPQAVAGLWLVAIAGFLVRFAKSPRPAEALALALAVGSSFMFRSDLILLPPALAAAALRLWKARDKKALAVLLLVPYLFTLPVTLANVRLHGRASPLEGVTGAWDDVAKGAIGLVQAGEPPLLEPYADGERSPLRWAARQAAYHPLRYLEGYLARLRQAAAWCSPFLFFALWAVWLRRKDRGVQALGLLAGYWLAFYCSIAIDERYFEPLMPLLILLACGLVGNLADRRPRLRRFPLAVLAGALACVLALDAYAAVQLLRGPRATIERAAERDPRDWWLLERRGEERLRQGDAAGAASDFASAQALLPVESSGSVYGRTLRFDRAAAAAFAGDASFAWALPLDDASERAATTFETRLLRAYARLRSGKLPEARAELAAARGRWELICRSVIGCAATDDGFAAFAAERLLTSWPSEPAARMAALLASEYPASVEARLARARSLLRLRDFVSAKRELDRAAPLASAADARASLDAAYALARDDEFEAGLERALASARSGRRAAAAKLLAGLEPASLAQRRALAAAYQDAGEPKRALALLESASAAPTAADLLDEAWLYAKLARPRDAEAVLAKAQGLALDAEQRRKIADLRARLAEDSRHAREQREFASAKDAEAAIEKARTLARRGDKRGARAELVKAAAAADRPEQTRRVAGVYADLGDFRGALDALRGLGDAKDADTLIERARYWAALGRASEASSDLRAAEAVGLDPDRGGRAALVYQELKDYRRAAELFERAAAAHPDEPGLRASLGVCQALSGQDDKAAATLEAVLAAHPRFLSAYLTLGFVYERRGERARAASVYERGLAQKAGPEAASLRAELSSARASLTRQSSEPILPRRR